MAARKEAYGYSSQTRREVSIRSREGAGFKAAGTGEDKSSEPKRSTPTLAGSEAKYSTPPGR
ncbi:MAG: hypothetical protein QXE79_05620 [Candidatus Bathyarchaeia archaeon]